MNDLEATIARITSPVPWVDLSWGLLWATLVLVLTGLGMIVIAQFDSTCKEWWALPIFALAMVTFYAVCCASEAANNATDRQSKERDQFHAKLEPIIKLAFKDLAAGRFTPQRIHRQAERRGARYLREEEAIRAELGDPNGLLFSHGKRVAIAEYAKAKLTGLRCVANHTTEEIVEALELAHTYRWRVLSEVLAVLDAPPASALPPTPEPSPALETIRIRIAGLQDKQRGMRQLIKAVEELKRSIEEDPNLDDKEKSDLRVQLATDEARLLSQFSMRRLA